MNQFDEKTYNEEWNERHNDLSRKHQKKLDASEKRPTVFLVKLFFCLSVATTLAGYVALAMVPFSDVELLHAACLFVIGHIIGKASSSWSDNAMVEVGASPTDYLGHILAHNALIGENIREIRKLLESQQTPKPKP